MPVLTTVIAGVSALAAVAGVSQAKKTAKNQQAAQARQQAATKAELAKNSTIAGEASKLDTQDKGLQVADVEIGTNKASDELLKRKKTSTTTKTNGTTVGGLTKGTATKVGGL
jgi:type II secretory pathway pseudopilin PulG